MRNLGSKAEQPTSPSVAHQLRRCLKKYLSPINAEATFKSGCARSGIAPERLTARDVPRVVRAMERSLALYLDETALRAAIHRLESISGAGGHRRRRPTLSRSQTGISTAGLAPPGKQAEPLVTDGEMPIDAELDVCQSRTAALNMARQIGFDTADAVKVATVVSELARNQLHYAGHGTIALRRVNRPRDGIEICASDQGPGIPNLEEILAGGYQSKTGLGLGLRGSSRMMDEFDVDTTPERGTVITARKYC